METTILKMQEGTFWAVKIPENTGQTQLPKGETQRWCCTTEATTFSPVILGPGSLGGWDPRTLEAVRITPISSHKKAI